MEDSIILVLINPETGKIVPITDAVSVNYGKQRYTRF